MDIKEILEERYNLLSKAKDNPELQQLIIAACKTDIMYFFKNFLYTDKNTNLFTGNEPNVLPFIPYPFQEEYILEVWESIMEWTKDPSERKAFTNVFVEKSRQMWLSWLNMWVFVYGRLFHDHKYLVISQKEEDVDKIWDMKSLFEKMRFMIDNLPTWILPQGFDRKRSWPHNKYKSIVTPDWVGTWSITWESANPNAGRWGTYNAIFLDEMAFMANATTINTACASATPCRIFNSTPNGEWNEFYRMRQLTQDRRFQWKLIKQQVKWLRYHRSEHPLYTKERYQWKTQGMTPEKIAQELEIDYNTAIVGRVYPEFNKNPSEFVYDPEKPMYVAIDNSHGWPDPNAMILAQVIDGRIKIFDAIEHHSPPYDNGRFLTNQPTTQLTNNQVEFLSRYAKYHRKKATFIWDPYDTTSSMGSTTILDEYRKVWINLVIPENRRKEDHILLTRTNIYRIDWNDNCIDFASAIMNARYPERKEWANVTSEQTKPLHDRTSHYRTALEYLVMYIIENPQAEKKKHVWLSDQPFNARYYR